MISSIMSLLSYYIRWPITATEKARGERGKLTDEGESSRGKGKARGEKGTLVKILTKILSRS